jgi:hypothetical protein
VGRAGKARREVDSKLQKPATHVPLHAAPFTFKPIDDVAPLVRARAIYVIGSDKPQTTDDAPSSEGAPLQPLNTEDADDEPPPLQTPNGLTNDERLLKTFHELRGTIARLESEAKAHTSTSVGPVAGYGVVVVPVNGSPSTLCP